MIKKKIRYKLLRATIIRDKREFLNMGMLKNEERVLLI